MKLFTLLACFFCVSGANTLRGNGRFLSINCTRDDECHSGGYCEYGACTCRDGNRGDGYWVCEDIDECEEENICGIGEEGREGIYCVDHSTIAKYECGCETGWLAILPEVWADPVVPRSYRPTRCADINECLEPDVFKPCHANATCMNTPGSYDCVCKSGFEGNGFKCNEIPVEILYSPCELKNCASNQYCHESDNVTAICLCKPGYIAPSGVGGACQDIDECRDKNHECDPNASCNNTIGSYDCECDQGWTGNGTICIDIDECEIGEHDCDPTEGLLCYNRPGSYYCGTDAPSTSPSTSFPSAAPSFSPICSVGNGTRCGMNMPEYVGCSCSNTCAAEGICCWDFEDACAGFIFPTTSIDVVLTAFAVSATSDEPGESEARSGSGRALAGVDSAVLTCDGVFLGRGVSSGCGFSVNFSTMSSIDLTCECIKLDLVGDDSFFKEAALTVYHNGIDVPLVPTNPNATSLSTGSYTLKCS